MSLLQKFSDEYEKPLTTSKQASSAGQPANKKIFDLRAFITKHDIQVNHEKKDGAKEFFVLKKCVFNPDHTGSKEACIFQDMNTGKLFYKCHHDSCKNKHWHDVRLLFEPDAYNERKKCETDEIKGLFELMQMQPERYIAQIRAGAISPGSLLDFCISQNFIVAFEDEDGGVEYFFKHKDFTFFLIKLYPHSFCFSDTLEWFNYSGSKGIYEKINENILTDVIYLTIQKVQAHSKEFLQNLIYFAKCHVMKDREEIEKRIPQNKICLRNGLFNTDTYVIEQFNPQNVFFAKIDIVFDPKAECPKIDNFLTGILPQRQSEFYEQVGYLLAPRNFLNKITIMVGQGNNGKSIAIELLSFFVGKGNVANAQLSDLMGDKNYCRAMLFGKLLCAFSDISNSDLDDLAFVKALTGEDRVLARHPYMKAFLFYYFGKLIFSANEPPIIREDTSAVWRRLHIIKFDQVIPPEKRKSAIILLAELTTEAELSGLLNKAIEQLKMIKEKMKFACEISEEENRRRYLLLSDSAFQFVDAHIETNCDMSKDYLLCDAVYNRYTSFCTERRLRAIPENKFPPIFLKHTQSQKGRVKRIGGKNNAQERVYFGINYKNNSNSNAKPQKTLSVSSKSSKSSSSEKSHMCTFWNTFENNLTNSTNLTYPFSDIVFPDDSDFGLCVIETQIERNMQKSQVSRVVDKKTDELQKIEELKQPIADFIRQSGLDLVHYNDLIISGYCAADVQDALDTAQIMESKPDKFGVAVK